MADSSCKVVQRVESPSGRAELETDPLEPPAAVKLTDQSSTHNHRMKGAVRGVVIVPIEGHCLWLDTTQLSMFRRAISLRFFIETGLIA